jgi:hypothetical protein
MAWRDAAILEIASRAMRMKFPALAQACTVTNIRAWRHGLGLLLLKIRSAWMRFEFFTDIIRSASDCPGFPAIRIRDGESRTEFLVGENRSCRVGSEETGPALPLRFIFSSELNREEVMSVRLSEVQPVLMHLADKK